VHEPPDVRAAMQHLAARQRKNMDWWGIGLLIAGLGSLQYVLEEGNRNDWFDSGEIKLITLFSIVSLALLVVRELSARVPAVDIVLFAYTAWLMGHYTLATSSRGIVNVLIIQGVAFSCLFIPLTTMALSTIPRHRLPDATGLNSLLRQVGGSIGLAIMATMMTRYATKARGAMLANVTMSRPAVAARVLGTQRMLTGRRIPSAAAQDTAARLIDFQ